MGSGLSGLLTDGAGFLLTLSSVVKFLIWRIGFTFLAVASLFARLPLLLSLAFAGILAHHPLHHIEHGTHAHSAVWSCAAVLLGALFRGLKYFFNDLSFRCDGRASGLDRVQGVDDLRHDLFDFLEKGDDFLIGLLFNEVLDVRCEFVLLTGKILRPLPVFGGRFYLRLGFRLGLFNFGKLYIRLVFWIILFFLGECRGKKSH